jgi:arylsulfatase A-like enzyme
LLLLFSAATAMAAPNIVVILTDDQDNTGSMAHMPKVLSLIAVHGITFDNSFVNLSLCAPSRSPLLTGQAAHNDGVVANQAAKGGGWVSFMREKDPAVRAPKYQ